MLQGTISKAHSDNNSDRPVEHTSAKGISWGKGRHEYSYLAVPTDKVQNVHSHTTLFDQKIKLRYDIKNDYTKNSETSNLLRCLISNAVYPIYVSH